MQALANSSRQRPAGSGDFAKRTTTVTDCEREVRATAKSRRDQSAAGGRDTVTQCIRTCSGTPAATNSPTMGMILVPCSTTLATRISSTPCAIRSFRLTASATSGGAEVATTCHRFGLLRGSGSIVPGRQTPRDPGSESTHSLSASLHAFSVACAVSGRYSPLLPM